MSRKPERILRKGLVSMSRGKGCGWFLGAVALVLLLWALLLPGLWPMGWFLYSMYSNPIGWLLFVVFIGAGVALVRRFKLPVKVIGGLLWHGAGASLADVGDRFGADHAAGVV